MERSAVFWTSEMQGAQAYDFCEKKKAKSCYLSGSKSLVINIEIPAQRSYLILIWKLWKTLLKSVNFTIFNKQMFGARDHGGWGGGGERGTAGVRP